MKPVDRDMQLKSLAQIVLETGEKQYTRYRQLNGDPYLARQCNVINPDGSTGCIYSFNLRTGVVGVRFLDSYRKYTASEVFPKKLIDLNK